MTKMSTHLSPKLKDVVCFNYVGKLNEFNSGKRLSQPIYTQSMDMSTQFCMMCSFLTFETKGFGRTKMQAKQDSAKNMLKLITEADLDNTPRNDVPQTGPLKCNQAQTDAVLDEYSKLMKNLQLDSKPPVSAYPEGLLVPAKRLPFSKWEDLERYFDSNRVSANLTMFQQKPLILCLKVNQLVFLNVGATREEILSKLLFTISHLVEQGWDLTMSPLQRAFV